MDIRKTPFIIYGNGHLHKVFVNEKLVLPHGVFWKRCCYYTGPALIVDDRVVLMFRPFDRVAMMLGTSPLIGDSV